MLEIGKTYDCVDGDSAVRIVHKLENPSFHTNYPYAGVFINKANGHEGAFGRFSAEGRCWDSGFDIVMPLVSGWYNVYASRVMSTAYASERDAASGARPRVNARLELRWRGDELVEAIVHKVQS